MARTVKPSDYPVLKKYEGTHDVSRALHASPPAFLAVRHSAIQYQTHFRGPLARLSTGELEQRLSAVRAHLLPAIERAWDSVGEEVRAKALKCWRICCDEKSEHYGKRRRGAAVVFEVTDVECECWGTATDCAACHVEVQLDFKAEDGHEEAAFAGAFEGFAEWFEERTEPVEDGGRSKRRDS